MRTHTPGKRELCILDVSLPLDGLHHFLHVFCYYLRQGTCWYGRWTWSTSRCFPPAHRIRLRREQNGHSTTARRRLILTEDGPDHEGGDEKHGPLGPPPGRAGHRPGEGASGRRPVDEHIALRFAFARLHQTRQLPPHAGPVVLSLPLSSSLAHAPRLALLRRCMHTPTR